MTEGRPLPGAAGAPGSDRAARPPGTDRAAGAPGSDRAAGAPGSDRAARAPGTDRAARPPGSDRPLRVVVVVEQLRRPVPGGIGTYAEGIVRGLAPEAGNGEGADEGGSGRGGGGAPRVELLASRPPRGEPDPLGALGRPVRASRLPGPLLTRAWDLGLLRAPGGFDVVHSTTIAAPRVRSHRGRRAVSVVTVHDLAWRHFPGATTPRGRRWHATALQRALREADHFVVPSEPVRDDLVAAGAAPGRIDVIAEGADHLPPPDTAGTDRLLASHGIGGPFLLAAGTLEPRKNLARLAHAYRQAVPALPEPWPLVLVGPAGWGSPASGPRADRADRGERGPQGGHDRAAPGAPVGRIVPVGRVPAPILAGLYERARLLAYVPLLEGYGLPPVEAMRQGTPVVASTGVPSAVAPGRPVAIRVDPLDVDAIAGALVSAATDDSVRRALAGAGRALAGRRTWDLAARQHLALWQRLR